MQEGHIHTDHELVLVLQKESFIGNQLVLAQGLHRLFQPNLFREERLNFFSQNLVNRQPKNFRTGFVNEIDLSIQIGDDQSGADTIDDFLMEDSQIGQIFIFFFQLGARVPQPFR